MQSIDEDKFRPWMQQIGNCIWKRSGALSSQVPRGLYEVYSNLYPSKG